MIKIISKYENYQWGCTRIGRNGFFILCDNDINNKKIEKFLENFISNIFQNYD